MESPGSPPNYDSDESDESVQNSLSISCKIKSHEDSELTHNIQPVCHTLLDTSREKDKLRIKELESEISVLQVLN